MDNKYGFEKLRLNFLRCVSYDEVFLRLNNCYGNEL